MKAPEVFRSSSPRAARKGGGFSRRVGCVGVFEITGNDQQQASGPFTAGRIKAPVASRERVSPPNTRTVVARRWETQEFAAESVPFLQDIDVDCLAHGNVVQERQEEVMVSTAGIHLNGRRQACPERRGPISRSIASRQPSRAVMLPVCRYSRKIGSAK